MALDKSMVRKVLRDCLRLDDDDYPAARVVTVAHDTDRSLHDQGRYYSPLIDTIEDDLAARGVRCVSFARVASRIKGPLAYGRVYSPDGQFARALVGKRLRALLQRDVYPYSHAEERTWGRILDRTGARKLVGIMPSRELCVACHRRGVWVADVQHGVIADSHPWYGASFRGGDPPEQLPDAFLCWEPGSAEAIGRWAHAQGVRTLVIGNRWLARFIADRPEDALVQRLAGDYRRRVQAAADRRKAILVTLSWGDDNNSDGFVDPGLRQVIRATSDRYRWLIRLHPNQVAGFASDEGVAFVDFFARHLQGHAEWELPTHAPLPAVLRDVDLHVSWYSSVALEAAQMGIRSALLSPDLRRNGRNEDYFSYHHRAGLIDFIAEDTATITAWIDGQSGERWVADAFAAYDAEYAQLLDFLASAEGLPP